MDALLKILGIQDNPFIIIIGALCLSVIALSTFAESVSKLSEIMGKMTNIFIRIPSIISASRRRFIQGSLTASATVIALYATGRFVKLKDILDFKSIVDPDGYLVANKKNGIVHHSVLCRYHLPDEKNQTLDFNKVSNMRLHNYRDINLYEIMANQFLKERNSTKSIYYFRKAIGLTPERVHLYDQVAKLYGKQKKYKDIKKQYEHGIKKVASKLEGNHNMRQLSKVIRDLESRIKSIDMKYS